MASAKRKKPSKAEKIVEQILNDHAARADIVRRRLEFFFLFYFSQYMEYQTAPFHEEIFRILENEKIRLAAIVAFRGSAKTTLITTAYVLWSILGVQQKRFIVICGQTEAKARQHLQNIKSMLLHNELLRRDLGPFEEEKNSLGNATAIIIKRLGVKIMIASTEQSIRGSLHGNHRPDLIILDDIEDTNSVKTREGRDKTFSWLTGDVIPAGDSKRVRVIAVGNLLHEDSVMRRLQKKIEGGEMQSLNAIYREYPIVDGAGNPLWPGKYPTPESVAAERERTMDDIAWFREYELKIVSSTEQVVHPEWIQFYDELPRTGLRGIAIGIDLAVSEKQSADCTAMVVGYIYGMGKNMKIYIQPNPINEQISFPVQIERVKALVAIHKQKHYKVKIYIENVGYQEAMVQALEANRYDVEGVPTGRNDKRTRLSLTTSFLKEGQILFPSTGCEELIEQLTGFGKEAHDDLADAFAILVLKAVENNPRGATFGVFGAHRPDAIG